MTLSDLGIFIASAAALWMSWRIAAAILNGVFYVQL